MSIQLKVGSTGALKIDSLKDLAHEALSCLELGAEFAGYLDQPISALPANLRATELVYSSGNQTWKPGDFSFTLGAGITGKIKVVPSGTLLTYSDDFATEVIVGSLDPKLNQQTSKSIAIPAGTVYVCIELDLQIGGGISGKFNYGIYGVSASVNTTDTFTVSFYKQCQPTDKLRDGVSAAMAGFVLPLHGATYKNLAVGDYLHHSFNANLQVGMGASIGMNKVLYAGQYTADIPAIPGAVPLTLAVKPQIAAQAELCFKFDYAGKFEALLWKADNNTGRLHLYRAQAKSTSVALNLGITFDAGASACDKVGKAQLTKALTALMPASAGAALANAVIPKAESEIEKGVSDANNKIAAWLKKNDQQQATLDFAIANTQQTYLLLDYTLQLDATAFSAAWKLAVNGKFVDALATPAGGVSISTGSGLENFYDHKTSIALNLFGKLKATWTEEVITNSSIVYAGNHIFHLIADVGRKSVATNNKSKREVDIYFAAEANLGDRTSNATLTLQPVNLHFILQANGDQKFGSYVSNMVSLLMGTSDGGAMALNVATMARQANTTEILHVVIAPGSYRTLKSSTMNNHKPDDESWDRTNYQAFADACSALIQDGPASFNYQNQTMDYGIWRDWNIALTDQWPARQGAVPDRTAPGNPANGLKELQAQFPQAGDSANLIGYALQAASDFMNLCEALKNLALLPQVEQGLDSWNALVTRLKSIITNDVQQDYVAPAMLALLRLIRQGPPDTTKGPATGLVAGNSIAVTMTYK